MPYRNKTFVSFDGDSDMHYYRLMQAWRQNDGVGFSFYNAHDLNTARDSSQVASIRSQLALRMRNSKVFVLLVGERTRYLTKFVRWEIEQAITRKMPTIAVNLNGRRSMDEDRCPPLLRSELAIHVSFNATILQHALENWPASDSAYRRVQQTGPYYYKQTTYEGLGL